MTLFEKLSFYCIAYCFIGRILAKKECCICKKNKSKKDNSGYEKLTKLLSKDAASNLKDACTNKKEMFHDLHVEFVGQNISAIVAKEYYFHETCRCLVLKKLPEKGTSTKPTAFAKLKNYVQSNIIERGEIIKMTELIDIYKELISENDEEESGLRV